MMQSLVSWRALMIMVVGGCILHSSMTRGLQEEDGRWPSAYLWRPSGDHA